MMNVYCCHYLSQIILLLDIDECADFTDECRPNGNCTNTIPHYYCTCNARYKAVANEMQCEGKQISNNFLSHFNPYSVNRSKKWIQQILTNWFLEDLEIGERVNKLSSKPHFEFISVRLYQDLKIEEFLLNLVEYFWVL